MMIKQASVSLTVPIKACFTRVASCTSRGSSGQNPPERKTDHSYAQLVINWAALCLQRYHSAADTLQKKTWHPLFRVDDLTLTTIKRNLVAARAAEATKELQAKGQTVGKDMQPSPFPPCPPANIGLGAKGKLGVP